MPSTGRVRGPKSTGDKDEKKCNANTHQCVQCRRSFSSASARSQHLRDSPRHRTNGALALSTPLDNFFGSFPKFPYNPKLSPEASYNSLKNFYGWVRDSPEDKTAWGGYREALAEEVKVWFGKEDDINAWHTLCRAIGVECPSTISDCEKLLRDTHVNIVDLIHWGRNEQNRVCVRVFRREKDLVEYTRTYQKIFPLDQVANSEGERNVVLRHLLRRIYK